MRVMEPSYKNFRTFHSFLDAADNDQANYPAIDACNDAIEYFGTSCLRTNGQGRTPLMRMALMGWDDLAMALAKKHPKASQAIDWDGRPVWYYLVSDELHAPDANSIRCFQKFLKFPPLKNGDYPQHVLARNIFALKDQPSTYWDLLQNKNSLFAFVSEPDSLLVANHAGERPLDILKDCLHVFDAEEQEAFQYLLNIEQNKILSSTVQDVSAVSSSRKM